MKSLFVLSPGSHSLSMHRFSRFCATAASRLAIERYPPPVPSFTGAGDSRTRPDVETIRTLSKTSYSEARPTPSEKRLFVFHNCEYFHGGDM